LRGGASKHSKVVTCGRPFLFEISDERSRHPGGSARGRFRGAPTPAELENAKARFLGKSGRVTELLKGWPAPAPEEKKTRGAEINQAKQRIEAALTARRQALADAELQRS
jgi:phenylalanyl-tRNA synthetase alpha subunit